MEELVFIAGTEELRLSCSLETEEHRQGRTALGEGDGRPHQLGVAVLQNIPQEPPQEKRLDVGSITATPFIAR